MNVLFIGTGQGSWVMRGQQIGRVLGARVTSKPNEADWAWADICVLVKHAGLAFCEQAHRYGVPIVWDVLDCWKQPDDNGWTIEQGKAFITGLQAKIKPAAMIAATERMARDIGGVYIPHHCRIGLKPTPPRHHVTTVGYDGQKKYLGRWFNAITTACRGMGWTFVINPTDLSQVDILVAFRDGKWDGPLCRAWKSGVKYVNAIRASRPILTQPCSAAEELQPLGEAIDDITDLGPMLAYCESIRQIATDWQPYTVDAIAEAYYRPLLERVMSTERVCA